MKLRNTVRDTLRGILLLLYLATHISLFNRKSHAMDLKIEQSAPRIGQLVQKEEYVVPGVEYQGPSMEVMPKTLVKVALTPVEEPRTSGSGSGTIASFPGEKVTNIPVIPGGVEQLGGALPITTTIAAQRSNPSTVSQRSAESIRSRRSSGSFSKTVTGTPQASILASDRPGPSGISQRSLPRLGSLRPTGLPQPSDMYLEYCGIKVPGSAIKVKAANQPFTLDEAKEKVKVWNEAIDFLVKPHHKPQRLDLDKLTDSDNAALFGASDPQYAFSSASRYELEEHLANLTNKPDTLQTFPTGKGKGKATVDQTITYNSKLIYDKTIPKGHYIQAFTFIDNYTEKDKQYLDNDDNVMMRVDFKSYTKDGKYNESFTGLVNPDFVHLSTGQ